MEFIYIISEQGYTNTLNKTIKERNDDVPAAPKMIA